MKLTTEQATLESHASNLLQLALKNGATAAEVCGAFGKKSRIALEKQDYHLASSDEGYSFGLRVLVGHRQGFASTNSTDPGELKRIAQRAVEIAKISPENPWYSIIESRSVTHTLEQPLWDEELCGLSLQTQRDWVKLIDAEASADKRFRLNEGSLGVSSGISVILNSRGTHKTETDTYAHWGMMGMAVEGDNITSFDYFQNLSRKLIGTPDLIRASASKFRNEVIRGLKCGKSQSYKGLVVFSPRAVLDILLSSFCYHLNGRTIVEGTSRFKMADLGKKVLDSDITFSDTPFETNRFGYTTFDREGTPTAENTLVSGGVLKTILLDGYSAAALGGKSTGHAAGGTTATPSVSTHSLTVAPGKTLLSDLFGRATAEQKEFLLVERYSGQSDPVTGDFSGVAKSSGWWHAGEQAYQVKETLISGNLFDVLGKGLVDLSKETLLVDNSEESPWLLADGVSVTGS